VFADADALVCGVLSPTAQAIPASGGLVVNGRWQFISGALHSKWQVVMGMAPTPDGAQQWPVMALVPLSDLTIIDDWHTSGLRGTGSVTTVADGVFVPHDRVLPVPLILQGQYASELNADSAIFRAPLMASGCTCFTGVAVGLAKAAAGQFMSRLDRKITYTDYSAQREAPLTHLQVADATLKIEEAESHARRLAVLADSKKGPDDEWTPEERVRSRAYLGRVFHLAKGAADTLKQASGGSSIYTAEPIQRMAQDIDALSMHALMHPTTNFELFGRVLCGLPANTMYL
jgi:alkylation response protein AidB-like acyl-CoA dehydrogenase